jgi:hypothetical protein
MPLVGTKMRPGRPQLSAKKKIRLSDLKQTFSVDMKGRQRAKSVGLNKLVEADRSKCLGDGKVPNEPVVCLVCHKVLHRVHFAQEHSTKCHKLNVKKEGPIDGFFSNVS